MLTMQTPNVIKKTIQPTGDLCIVFTDEEMSKLGIKPGDKFSWTEQEEGFLLQKYKTLEIDLKDFSRDNLELLIQLSCEQDISINEVIENILTEFVKLYDKQD